MTEPLPREPIACTLPGLLVSTDWLAEYLHASDLRVVDVRPADAFAEGHIPGAVQIDLAALTTTVDGVQGMLIGPDAFAAMMGQLGIDEEHAVVLYDSNWGMPAARVPLVPGAGVDIDAFTPTPEPTGTPVVMLPARLLWDKGVGEFVDAARMLKEDGVDARFVLVGDTDLGNRAGVPRDLLDEWREEGAVELWGHRADMPTVYAQANLVCLPSYREGLPKTLLEAAAAGRAIVTTDVTGCRDAVADGKTGVLVPPRDPFALAAAIKALLENPDRCRAYGAAGRSRVEREFSTRIINPQIIGIYRAL